ncbi:MAG: exodeoxyribonuclease VII small subunit [Armatimonadia bacterium]
MATDDKLTFEQALVRLEEIVEQLDAGDIALEQALALFEEGSKLRAFCEQQLAEAEAIVEQLTAPEAGPGEQSPSEPAVPETLFGDDQ